MSAQAHPTVARTALGAHDIWECDRPTDPSQRERLCRELEEARAAADVLRQANQQLTDLLHIASHELRAPLTAITASEQLAARRLLRLREALRRDPATATTHARAAERARAALARVDQQAHRLSRLVDDLLDAARTQSGKAGPAAGPCDLAVVIQEVVAEHRLAWPGRHILVALPEERAEHAEHPRPGAPAVVLADPMRLARVVTNFLTNALKFSPDDRLVEVRLILEGNLARIAVRDEGPGLPDTERERVWDRFHQVADADGRDRAEPGLGLGLYIARTIITEYGGRVGVRAAPGQGATFWCELPLAHGANPDDQRQP
jgi:signal transduction histidine kinase